jgi:cytochrome b subunit of formate dehydrogenase
MWYAILLAAIFLICITGTVLLIVYYYWGPKGPPGK